MATDTKQFADCLVVQLRPLGEENKRKSRLVIVEALTHSWVCRDEEETPILIEENQMLPCTAVKGRVWFDDLGYGEMAPANAGVQVVRTGLKNSAA